MFDQSRRNFLNHLASLMVLVSRPIGVSTVLTETFREGHRQHPQPQSMGFSRERSIAARRYRIRTITAGVTLKTVADLGPIASAIRFLHKAHQRFEEAGINVQTLRIATQPLPEYMAGHSWREVLPALKAIDRRISTANVLMSIGPVLTEDRTDADIAPWAAELINETSRINLSITMASPGRGIHRRAIRTAAQVMGTIGKRTPGGEGNFRFTAAANCPAGIPFFPAAYHRGEEAFAIGLESPLLVQEAFMGAADVDEARSRLKTMLESELGRIEELALGVARETRRRYLGIDVSPAPSKEASIGRAIEMLTHAPFGQASTVMACAVITDVLQALNVRTCGYSGLMLPVLEDPVLARRAAEGRYGVHELLLYSSVCGTGLDVVPLPGDTSIDRLTALMEDVAALSTKLRKPLSARLLLVPGKKAGDHVEFDNPFLTDSVIMKLD